MAGLFASLNSSVKALAAHSRAIEVTGKNLANVNNTEYARQRVIYGDRGSVMTPTGAESLGLEALGVEQLRDSLLDRQVLREVSLKASYESQQSAYQRAQAGLGQSIDRSNSATETAASGTTGIAAALDDFFNAFQSFAARPTDDGERQTLLQKAGILTDRFQQADARSAQVQSDLNAQISTDVEDINKLLETIADLNEQIGRFEINQPGTAVDLRDQRQARLEELAARLPFEVRDTPSGQIEVFAKDSAGAEVMLVNLANVTGPVSFNGTQLLAGSPATALDVKSGSVYGALVARDDGIQTLRNDLDALARQIVSSVNGAYNPSGLTGDFFNVPAAPGGVTASNISLVSTLTAATLKASDTTLAGDNKIARDVAALATKKFEVSNGDQIDGTFSGFFSKTVSKLGQALATANSRVEDQSNIEQLVRSQRDAVSGVSLDEEMANLMKYQRSFQASSRVFTVIDDLLDAVVNGLGR